MEVESLMMYMGILGKLNLPRKFNSWRLTQKQFPKRSSWVSFHVTSAEK